MAAGTEGVMVKEGAALVRMVAASCAREGEGGKVVAAMVVAAWVAGRAAGMLAVAEATVVEVVEGARSRSQAKAGAWAGALPARSLAGTRVLCRCLCASFRAARRRSRPCLPSTCLVLPSLDPPQAAPFPDLAVPGRAHIGSHVFRFFPSALAAPLPMPTLCLGACARCVPRFHTPSSRVGVPALGVHTLHRGLLAPALLHVSVRRRGRRALGSAAQRGPLGPRTPSALLP